MTEKTTLESLVINEKIKMIPYSSIASAVKLGKPLGKGSTGAMKLIIGKRSFLYKSGTPGHVTNEFIAYVLFEAAGARVPPYYLVINVEAGGIPQGILTYFYENSVSIAEAYQYGIPLIAKTNGNGDEVVERMSVTPDMKAIINASLQEQMVIHALFLNWDAKNWENFLIQTKNGKVDFSNPITIDLGGALYYRAGGELKSKRSLLTEEIQELHSIPEFSHETKGKFFVNLQEPIKLKQMVCDWTTAHIHSEEIMRVVEALKPLFGFLPRGSDLPGLVAGRLNALQEYCKGSVTPYSVGYSLITGSYRTKPESRESEIIRKRLATIQESLVEEATVPFLYHGKREIVPAGMFTPDVIKSYMQFIPTNPATEKKLKLVEMNEDGYPIYETNSENGDEEERNSLLPQPRYTLSIRAPESVQHSILSMREDPNMTTWLKKQIEYVEKLSRRERDILTSYTRHGDVLVNNYLRGTLEPDCSDLIRKTLEVTTDFYQRPVALAYSIYDQFSTLTRQVKTLRLPPDVKFAKDLLDVKGELNMDTIRAIIDYNMDYFGRTINILPLIEQFRRNLVEIIEKAPRAIQPFRVFRGIATESHIPELSYKTRDFFSTTISPDDAVMSFTKEYSHRNNFHISRSYRCCIYEFAVRADVPCIYMEGISQYRGEYEILIVPNITVMLDNKVYIKRMIEAIKGLPESLEDLAERMSGETRHVLVSVVEGKIHPPKVQKKEKMKIKEAIGGAGTNARNRTEKRSKSNRNRTKRLNRNNF